MDIKATDVKALREKTGAGMMECKQCPRSSVTRPSKQQLKIIKRERFSSR